jgi:hypothetical protein
MEVHAFLTRVLKHAPASPPAKFELFHWAHGGRPTEEAFGILAIPGLDPQKAIDAVMDVDHYTGNVEHVAACRSIKDARYPATGASTDAVRFYQRVDVPLLGAIHHELVIQRLGSHQGFLVAGWDILAPETTALNAKEGYRSDYSHGVWLAAPGMLGYAFGSAPKRDDVGFLKWKALTSGADAAAGRVLRANIEGMARWSNKRG